MNTASDPQPPRAGELLPEDQHSPYLDDYKQPGENPQLPVVAYGVARVVEWQLNRAERELAAKAEELAGLHDQLQVLDKVARGHLEDLRAQAAAAEGLAKDLHVAQDALADETSRTEELRDAVQSWVNRTRMGEAGKGFFVTPADMGDLVKAIGQASPSPWRPVAEAFAIPVSLKILWERDEDASNCVAFHGKLEGMDRVTMFRIESMEGSSWHLAGAFIPDDMEGEQVFPTLEGAQGKAAGWVKRWLWDFRTAVCQEALPTPPTTI